MRSESFTVVGMSQELSRMAAIRASCAARVATSIRLLHHRSTPLYANLTFRKTIRRIIVITIINILVAAAAVIVVVIIIIVVAIRFLASRQPGRKYAR